MVKKILFFLCVINCGFNCIRARDIQVIYQAPQGTKFGAHVDSFTVNDGTTVGDLKKMIINNLKKKHNIDPIKPFRLTDNYITLSNDKAPLNPIIKDYYADIPEYNFLWLNFVFVDYNIVVKVNSDDTVKNVKQKLIAQWPAGMAVPCFQLMIDNKELEDGELVYPLVVGTDKIITVKENVACLEKIDLINSLNMLQQSLQGLNKF